jgi:hypothetical protein
VRPSFTSDHRTTGILRRRETIAIAPEATELNVVVPIVSASPETGRVYELWGTGFFVEPKLLMSAKHVLGAQMPDGQRLCVIQRDPDLRLVPISGIYLDPEFDLAIAMVQDRTEFEHLVLADSSTLPYNVPVLTVEYSATEQTVARPDGDVQMIVIESWHHGNVIRGYQSTFGHAHPTEVIDVSYPAFRGASGAPVFRADNGDVLGLVVANIGRHLLPAYLERIETDEGVAEEIRYYVPNAQAIGVRHLRNCLTTGPVEIGLTTEED